VWLSVSAWHTAGVTREGPAKAPNLGALLWLGMASSLVFASLSVIAAREGIFEIDRSTDALVGLVRRGFLVGTMQTVSLIGQASALVPLIVVASLFMWRGRRRWALALPLVMAGAGGLQFLAKWAVDRPRPNEAPWGFPSGHALIVVVFLGVLTYLLCTSSTPRRWRCAGVGLCVATAVAVGFSRLYLDMHWVSDVGGGFAVGLAYLPLTIWLVEVVPVRSRVLRSRVLPD
jgi:membrane-associated phospholipid phosphatase